LLEDDITRASHARTVVVGPFTVADRLRALVGDRARIVGEGDDLEIGGTRVRVLPAQGPPRAVGFHPAATA